MALKTDFFLLESPSSFRPPQKLTLWEKSNESNLKFGL